ncbi:hypothetical protein SteCoe_12014 [Stentor coeruleus]|uniref:Uncharacterized protein n=1 Tax=Stentor coeruleus TaxID=5963 RepID=A0A1R2CBT2_9CILI|nr:hypothetical protein SteCoe_12014 [Stentor coeruleus]
MENVEYSDERTLRENIEFAPSKLCELCKNSLKKSQVFFCKCCYSHVCGLCSVIHKPSSETFCSKCQKSISKTYENLQFTIQQLKNVNHNLTISMMESMQERHEIRNKIKEKVPESKKIISLNDTIQRLKEDFYDSFMAIMNKQREKRTLIEKLNQKQGILYDDHKKDLTICFKIKNTKIMSNYSKNTRDSKDVGITDKKTLEQENMIFEEQIKELEIEYAMFYNELNEALKYLKGQIIKEKSEKPRKILELAGVEKVEDIRENIKLLKEELQITQNEIEILAERYARKHMDDVKFMRNFEFRKCVCLVF